MNFKICTKCRIKKSLDEFYKDRQKKDGLSSACKKCIDLLHSSEHAKELKRKRRENPKSKLQTFKYNLKNNFQLTLEQYDRMFEEQNGVCIICGGINESGRRLGVDHNHQTGKIRGLLCARCNFALGIVEDVNFVNKAKQYLRRYSD